MPGITDPNQEYFKDGTWGWDGTRWRKLALVFGYSDIYGETVFNAAAAAGTNYLTFSTVPAGEVWVVSNFTVTASDASPTVAYLDAYIDGAIRPMRRIPYTVANNTADWQGMLVLDAGCYLRGGFTTCGVGIYIAAYACGYKMKVA